MIKRLFTVIVLLLAIHFLAVLAGVGWLWQNGRLDRGRIGEIRQILSPPPAVPTTKPVGENAATEPSFRLDELLASQSGRTASEQTAAIQKAFDERMMQLDESRRQVEDRSRQVDLANQKLAADRAVLDKQKKDLLAQQQQTDKLQNDQGFQDSLALYQQMPTNQVKTIFMSLSPKVVQQYLQAMEPRTAGKIVAAFKTPQETVFIQGVLEQIRQNQPTDTTTASAAGKPPGTP